MWSFLQDPSLPIHNNAHERELRSAVIKRRLSFGSDTQEGGAGVCGLALVDADSQTPCAAVV